MFALPLLLLAQPEPPKPLVPYPHPLITEVLYAVPTGAAGDANKDGVRDTSGDEFIEIVNPHDKPISLRGYSLSGKAPEGSAKGKYKVLKFVFPALELAPGEVAVVFNGHDAKWTGPVGDTARGPQGPNETFFGARVFTMNIESARMGLANKADYVLLTSPRGEMVQCITWGEIKPPEGIALVEESPPVTNQSAARRDAHGALEPHPPLDGVRYSPGRFPLDAPERSPGQKAPDKPEKAEKPPRKP